MFKYFSYSFAFIHTGHLGVVTREIFNGYCPEVPFKNDQVEIQKLVFLLLFLNAAENLFTEQKYVVCFCPFFVEQK
jgi:hypothetical protein